jgi:hypothetical protein
MMKTIKPIFAPFMALFLALFAAVVPIYASSLTFGGYHDDGVSNGYHYFEFYWYSSDSSVDCSPTTGNNGSITVNFSYALQQSQYSWVPAFDVYQSWAGQSGFSQRECQVNVYALNGAGLRDIFFTWSLNGTVQSGNPSYAVTF